MENVKITSYSSDFGTKETEYDTPQRYPHSDVECHGAIPFSQPWVTPCGDSELYTPQVVNLFCDGSLDQLNEAPESSVPTPEAPASRPKKATGVALKNYDIRLPLENDIYFSIDILQELGRIGIRLNQDTRKWNIVGSESPFVHPDNLLISRTTWKSNPILNTLKTIRCRSGTGRWDMGPEGPILHAGRKNSRLAKIAKMVCTHHYGLPLGHQPDFERYSATELLTALRASDKTFQARCFNCPQCCNAQKWVIFQNRWLEFLNSDMPSVDWIPSISISQLAYMCSCQYNRDRSVHEVTCPCFILLPTKKRGREGRKIFLELFRSKLAYMMDKSIPFVERLAKLEDLSKAVYYQVAQILLREYMGLEVKDPYELNGFRLQRVVPRRRRSRKVRKIGVKPAAPPKGIALGLNGKRWRYRVAVPVSVRRFHPGMNNIVYFNDLASAVACKMDLVSLKKSIVGGKKCK